MTRHGKENIVGLLFLLPSVLTVDVIMVYPVIQSLNLNFYRQYLLELQGKYIGLENYIRLFTHSDFYYSLEKGFIWTEGTQWEG